MGPLEHHWVQQALSQSHHHPPDGNDLLTFQLADEATAHKALQQVSAQVGFPDHQYCFHSAGCGAASAGLHSALDIKHLMLDSLGWLLPRALHASANFDLATEQINATVRLYNHVNKDTADHIITAYRSGTFYQIRDIYNLRAKITQSHHYASIDTERVFLQLLTEV